MFCKRKVYKVIIYTYIKMGKKVQCNMNLDDDIINQVKDIQETLVGSSNISGLTEKLLIQWCNSFKKVELDNGE